MTVRAGSTIESDASDAAGQLACAGTPRRCDPLVMQRRTSQQGTRWTDPVVANGVVFVADDTSTNFNAPTSFLHVFTVS